MMVDSLNDLGLGMSLRKTRGRGEGARRGILSRFLAALPVDLSFSHNRLAREEGKSIALSLSIPLPFRSGGGWQR